MTSRTIDQMKCIAEEDIEADARVKCKIGVSTAWNGRKFLVTPATGILHFENAGDEPVSDPFETGYIYCIAKTSAKAGETIKAEMIMSEYEKYISPGVRPSGY